MSLLLQFVFWYPRQKNVFLVRSGSVSHHNICLDELLVIKCAEHVIYGLDEAVMTMAQGEVASFTIPPQHAFGTVGSNQYPLAVIPPNSVVTYEIELLSVENVCTDNPPFTFHGLFILAFMVYFSMTAFYYSTL